MNNQGAPRFENLPEAKQTEVLRYLQATNSDDVEEATRVMHTFRFNIGQAISQKFGGGATARSHQQTQQHRQPSVEQQRELGQYIRHLQELYRQRTVWKVISVVAGRLTKGLFRKVGGFVLPDCLKKRLLLSKFDRMYEHVSRGLKFQSSSLSEVMQRGRYHEKPCLLFISSPNRPDETLLDFLANAEPQPILNNRFFCYGLTWDSEQLRELEQPIEQKTQLLAVYLTIMDKKKKLETFLLDEKDTPLATKQFQEVINKYRAERRHEKNILIRYNNMILAHLHDDANTELMEEQIPEHDVNYEYERKLLEQQQKEYELAMQESKLAQQRKETEYERQRRNSEELQSLKEQRKLRKMSIPDEPQEGDIIKLHFRCPDGTKLVRNFPKDEHLELVYNWVETNDDIEFEDDKRHFELLAGYPPLPLSEKKDQRIVHVFEDDRELIQIKEL